MRVQSTIFAKWKYAVLEGGIINVCLRKESVVDALNILHEMTFLSYVYKYSHLVPRAFFFFWQSWTAEILRTGTMLTNTHELHNLFFNRYASPYFYRNFSAD